LAYLDRALDSGYRPGMGHVIADRLFWAHDDAEEGAQTPEEASDTQTLISEGFSLPGHETRH